MRHLGAVAVFILVSLPTLYGQNIIYEKQPMICSNWLSDRESMELSYLKGLQLGYETAWDDFVMFSKDQGEDVDTELPAGWTNLLVPAPEQTWEDYRPAVHAFCSQPEHSSTSVASEVITTIDDISGKERPRITPDEREHLLWDVTCHDWDNKIDPMFFFGYRDGQIVNWLTLLQASKQAPFKDQLDSWAQSVMEIQFKVPSLLTQWEALKTFCHQTQNQRVTFPFAVRASAELLRGENKHADELLNSFYCRALPEQWINGTRINGEACLDVIVAVTDSPFDKPFGYAVSVMNRSDKTIVIDWPQLSLVYTDQNRNQTLPAKDPTVVINKIEKRAKLAAALAAFGTYLSSTAPTTAVIHGPEGTSTISIYPSASLASSAAQVSAQQAAAPHEELASTMSEIALRKTTLPPGSSTPIAMVFFDKPKVKSFQLQMSIPDVPLISIDLSKKE